MSDTTERRLSFPNREHTPSSMNDNYLLAIGIDKYLNYNSLGNAVRDTKMFIDILQKKYRFKPEFTYSLFDEKATREDIWETFDELTEKLTEKDNLIIYYAGHGFLDNKDWGYWIPYEAKFNRKSTFIQNSDIANFLDEISAHHILVISDSCFSGSFFNAFRGHFEPLDTDSSRWAITSGRKQVVSDGETGHNSPFSTELLNILEKNNTELPISDLGIKLKSILLNNKRVNQTPRIDSLNVKGHDGGEFIFIPNTDEEYDWFLVKDSLSIEAYKGFILKYPKGKYKWKAESDISILEKNKTIPINVDEFEQKLLQVRNETQEEVLRKTGRDLHDGLGGLLVTVVRELELLKRIAEIKNGPSMEQYHHTKEMAQKSIDEMRRISHGLASLSLESGLIPAIKETIDQIKKLPNSPDINFETYQLEEIQLDAKAELYIFRMVQESLTNVLKYANAKKVVIQLISGIDILNLYIEDDGAGFDYDPEKIKNEMGLGLSSLKNRAKELGGKFSLQTELGNGTKINISIPLKNIS